MRAGAQADFLRDIGGYAFEKLGAVGKKHDGKIGSLRPQGFQQQLGFGIIGGKLNVDPLVGNVIACEKVAQLVGPG